MPLRVPKRYEGGLARIRDLSDDSAQEFLAALQQVPSTINQDSLSSAVAAMVDTVAASDVDEAVPALLFLYSLRDRSQSSASDIADGVAREMERAATENDPHWSKSRDLFRTRLVELLSVDKVRVVARAGGLLLENEHSLTRARVITEIRPVFEQENPKATPEGAMIVHTLKISYWADEETKHFFVALDENDVSDLSEQLGRANSKAESLKAILEKAQVPYIGVE